MLPDFIKHLQSNPDSFISRIYGLYEITMPGLSSIYIMVQKNCLKVQEGNSIIMQFDLKGSFFNRQTLGNHVFDLHKKEYEKMLPASVQMAI
jgi:hypothetical protein